MIQLLSITWISMSLSKNEGKIFCSLIKPLQFFQKWNILYREVFNKRVLGPINQIFTFTNLRYFQNFLLFFLLIVPFNFEHKHLKTGCQYVPQFVFHYITPLNSSCKNHDQILVQGIRSGGCIGSWLQPVSSVLESCGSLLSNIMLYLQ